MKKYNLKTLLSLFIVMLFAQINYAQTVTIGTQVWTSKNLDVSRYRNGDVIPQVRDYRAWALLTTGAWCYYDNDELNGKNYGKLYNWYAVNDPRGLAPEGYHIPTDAEWKKLSDYLGGEKNAGLKMRNTSGWYYTQIGNNISGFSGLPGGMRLVDQSGRSFYELGNNGLYWSATEGNTIMIYSTWPSGEWHRDRSNGFSVRCIKD